MNTIAATATATGLTVTAVLDAGRYPTGAQVSDAQMQHLEDRVIARHGFHGDWNYTILAVPRPAPDPGRRPPAPQPPRPAPDLAALDQPALTGLPPGAAAVLAATLAEARLHAARGGRGPPAAPHRRQRLPAEDHLHRPHPGRHLLPAVRPARPRDRRPARLRPLHHRPRTAPHPPAPAATATAIPPGPVTLATYQDLRDYAATAGITLPALTAHTPSTPR